MNSLEILLAMAFAVFLMPPCEAAWEDEDQETDLGFPDQAGGIEDDLHGTAERSWKQRNRWEDSSEFPARKMYMYPLNRPLPYSSSRIHSCPSLRSLEPLKQKRYSESDRIK